MGARHQYREGDWPSVVTKIQLQTSSVQSESSWESSSSTGVSQELLWPRLCDNSGTQKKGNVRRWKFLTRGLVKTAEWKYWMLGIMNCRLCRFISRYCYWQVRAPSIVTHTCDSTSAIKSTLRKKIYFDITFFYLLYISQVHDECCFLGFQWNKIWHGSNYRQWVSVYYFSCRRHNLSVWGSEGSNFWNKN
jgi:hypothetical protein